MIPVSELQRRSMRGPIMEQKDFDLKLSKTVRQLVHDREIRLRHEEIIPDDATADAIFEAGVDFLAEVGLYHMDTRRVLQFSREEVLAVAQGTPPEQTLGLGQDWMTIRARKPEDSRPPAVVVDQETFTEAERFVRVLKRFSQEDNESGRLAASLLQSLEGVTNLAHTPGEIAWEVAYARWKRDAARRIGRPDMYLGKSDSISIGAIMAGFTSEGAYRPATAQVPMHIMPEQKIDWDRLSLSLLCQEMGGIPFVSALTILGAYCRGPEEAAIVLVANVLGTLAYSHGSISTMRAQVARGPDTSVEASVAAIKAFSMRTNIPVCTQCVRSVADQEAAFYARAATAVAATACGTSWTWQLPCMAAEGGGLSVGPYARLTAGVYHAVAGMKRDQALDLFRKLETRYTDKVALQDPSLVSKSLGQGEVRFGSFVEDTLVPTREYQAMYQRAKDDLETLGICYDDEEMGTYEKLTAREWFKG
ncbi:MAG: monomethylamine:corrinoid methyltransferase, partial [Chloroflexi bacterium]|nr:monomethylamine:corrinoid methyltransferase [Chloroflexota bacterium]